MNLTDQLEEAELALQALRAIPVIHRADEEVGTCILCRAAIVPFYQSGAKVLGQMTEEHKPDCPFRMADDYAARYL